MNRRRNAQELTPLLGHASRKGALSFSALSSDRACSSSPPPRAFLARFVQAGTGLERVHYLQMAGVVCGR